MLASSKSLQLDNQEKVELFMSCRDLTNVSSECHPSAKIKLYSEKNGIFTPIGETEVVHDNLNPDFSKTVVLNYYFEMTQRLKFEILHVEATSNPIIIGEVFTTLGSIIGASRQTIMNGLDILKNGIKAGKLMVKFEKVAINRSTSVMAFEAQISKSTGGWLQYFDVLGLFPADNPVLKLYRITNDFDYVLIYESEMVSNTLKPSWRRFEMKVSKLCNSDYFRPIKAQVYARYNHKDTLVGECQFTIDEALNKNTRSFVLVDPVSKSQKGSLNLTEFKVEEKPDFLDYIRGGTQLNVIVGVDFTASNGDPNHPSSLHSLKFDGTLNEYQQAIYSVCNILLDYDYDKRVLLYGFGGKPRYPNYSFGAVQHCFPLTGNPQNPWVSELVGIMDAYSCSLRNVELSGPTLFAPILQEAMKIAEINKRNGSSEYTILLIITDGEIHDMESTINCLIKSAQLPLSVIIVGVGSADFKNMEILDGDDGLYNSQGIKAERDLVQFVPFRDFKLNMEQLAKEVLEEVPDQLVEYMLSQKIEPSQPAQFDMSQVLAFNQPSAPNIAEINFAGQNNQ